MQKYQNENACKKTKTTRRKAKYKERVDPITKKPGSLQ